MDAALSRRSLPTALFLGGAVVVGALAAASPKAALGGLAALLVLLWALRSPVNAVYLLVARRLPVRQDQVVDGKRADDVEGQPPAV